ncbi:Erg28-domain-containing protein [Artomyces pyxidatus]|uniref:Erg28-domain-containing protein n=1 Tax=Artomyces pyxidatus TaxID=48021 RepID=A0ACB8STS6_9AGAM|nr:Erg28-domain-containing protein [Artomyces pyxidatus]
MPFDLGTIFSLPGPAGGLLPYWQFLIASVALLNGLQNIRSPDLCQRLYSVKSEAEVTPLQARAFGTWTMTSAVARFYAAYNITDRAVYHMTVWTYIIALLHFTSEIAIFRTAKLEMSSVMPFLVAGTSIIWMIMQYNFYLST